MNAVMQELGVPGAGAECLLVGARLPGYENPNEVCVEPEEGKWPISLFEGLLEAIEAEAAIYPERNRRDAVRRAVQKILAPYDAAHGVHSFAGLPAPVADYYVVPVLQLSGPLFERFPPLHMPVSESDDGRFFPHHASLIHAAIEAVLVTAHNELDQPEPGHRLRERWTSAEELVRQAAADFMYTLGIAIGDRSFIISDLFTQFNLISSWMYEGMQGTGRLLLAMPTSDAVDKSLQFAEPVPFREPRWARKVLQMAAAGKDALIADSIEIFGLGAVAADHNPEESQDVFTIEFVDHYHWRLSCGNKKPTRQQVRQALIAPGGVVAHPAARYLSTPLPRRGKGRFRSLLGSL